MVPPLDKVPRENGRKKHNEACQHGELLHVLLCTPESGDTLFKLTVNGTVMGLFSNSHHCFCTMMHICGMGAHFCRIIQGWFALAWIITKNIVKEFISWNSYCFFKESWHKPNHIFLLFKHCKVALVSTGTKVSIQLSLQVWRKRERNVWLRIPQMFRFILMQYRVPWKWAVGNSPLAWNRTTGQTVNTLSIKHFELHSFAWKVLYK